MKNPYVFIRSAVMCVSVAALCISMAGCTSSQIQAETQGKPSVSYEQKGFMTELDYSPSFSPSHHQK